MEDFKQYAIDQIESLDEENISRQKIEEVFKFITDYAEDNYVI